jgi:predicted alpha/beta-hydrolase family hydrolase
MDSPFMAVISAGLAADGWRVVRFEFPYMARIREMGRRQGPDRMPVLQDAFRQWVRLERAAAPNRPLIIGGKSMGGRVASLLADELADYIKRRSGPDNSWAQIFRAAGVPQR